MTEAAPNIDGLLSRDEMDSLFDGLTIARNEEAGDRDLQGQRPQEDPQRGLRRDLEGVAEHYGKRLSTVYQRRIEWNLRGLVEIDSETMAELARPGDLFWVFDLDSGGVRCEGWVSWSRSLIFAWLQIAFGALEPRGLPLQRSYTAIERNFLARLGREITELLEPALATCRLDPTDTASLQDAGDLLARGGSGWLEAHYQVRGFGDLGQVRVGIPLRGSRGSDLAGSSGATATRSHEPAVYAAPVALHAEVGSAAISVQSLASLRAGDVVALDAATDGSLLLKVGGVAKFRARRGAVGERLAVQVTERIGSNRRLGNG